MTAPPGPKKLTSLCVFCGSQTGHNRVFGDAAAQLGRALAAHGAALVFGGGKVGLMGAIADAVLADGGTAIGVIPDFLKDKELAHARATEMVLVPDMHTRKRVMFERSDAFCILPGGVGTLDEMFEIVTWRQLHLHNKPIIVLNTDGYWDHMRALLERIIGEGFAHRGHGDLLTVVDRPEQVIATAEKELATPRAHIPF